MDITVIKGGKFNLRVKPDQFVKGLRPSENVGRNTEFATTLTGAVGQEGSLTALEQITRMATSTITDGFPFPQLFVCLNCIIVCGAKTIYEWNGSSLVLKYTAASVGGMWSIADYYDYVVLTNGSITVTKSPESLTYSLSSTLPHGTALCNFNGQMVMGAPNVDGLVYSLTIKASPFVVTSTIQGTHS